MVANPIGKTILRSPIFDRYRIKKYRWLHNLLRIHGIELQSEMIICSQCRNAFYKENKRHHSSNVGPVFDDDGLKGYPEEENEKS